MDRRVVVDRARGQRDRGEDGAQAGAKFTLYRWVNSSSGIGPLVAAALGFNIRGWSSWRRGVVSRHPALAAGFDGLWQVDIRGVVRPQRQSGVSIGTGRPRIRTEPSQTLVVKKRPPKGFGGPLWVGN